MIISTGDTVTAAPGENGKGLDGGSGYSGGGGPGSSYRGNGGRNGGDGQDGDRGLGGHGSGMDISLYTFTTWSLSPGLGGKHFFYFGGGGGGGVLVDGVGPDREGWGGEYYEGEGYGGGGCGASSENSNGLQGVILIEISN